ncbi:MAG: glycogen debranching enzyme N-terminal domain-containing protein, partial [Gemmatimonadetes bacterium]|nr:glycogen debranching enzyme N-terminal domain-containing protein [Gemmatimonadota bacterium]
MDAGLDLSELLDREWLVTNGLGGYASRTVSSAATRRHHGLLVAGLPAPYGRMVMLSDVAETLETAEGDTLHLGGEERIDALQLHGARHLRSFRLENGLPVWTYACRGAELEKRLMMPHGQNSTLIVYRLRGSASAVLRLRPLLHIRPHDAPVDEPLRDTYRAELETPHEAHHAAASDRLVHLRVVADAELPCLRLKVHGDEASYEPGPERSLDVLYRVEAARGYGSVGDLWSPGTFAARLDPDRPVGLAASAGTWASIPDPLDEVAWRAENDRRARLVAMAVPAARSSVAAELVIAADAFVVDPATREEDAARARAEGEEARSIIAGYHWFTDWGRDTMISLEGLALTTGRHGEAGAILRTFARHARDGLIPNLFPEGRSEGLYHTADATLWFFHALDRYTQVTGDEETALRLRPVLHDIVRHHLRGTRFGIGVDPGDGLLRQGADGYQLTWMDAKVGDWVVTPRRGKAVEINALWYNALRVLAEDRATMADELRSERQGFSGDASADLVESQAVVEPIEKAIEQDGPVAILVACENAETAIEDAYQRALEEEGLPPDVRERLEQHLEILESGRNELIALSHARVG